MIEQINKHDFGDLNPKSVAGKLALDLTHGILVYDGPARFFCNTVMYVL